MLARTIFELIFNLLKHSFDLSSTNRADSVSALGAAGFTLWIKAVASHHTDTLKGTVRSKAALFPVCFISKSVVTDANISEKCIEN